MLLIGFPLLKTVVASGHDESTVIRECKRCGTTLEVENETCPYCGPTEVVRYEIR